MRLSLFLTLMLLGSTSVASAQSMNDITNRPQAGMRHMSIAKDKKVETEKAPAAVEPAQAAPETTEAKKPLTSEQALKKPEDLAEWPYLSAALLASSKDSVDRLVKIVEANPGSVPPQGLFLLAKGLADTGRMADAAMYYNIGQLRLSFDALRWPATLDPADEKRRLAERNKTPDQRSAIPTKSTLQNPHEGVAMIATTIGSPIIQWMLEEPARADVVLSRVKTWDEQTPYAYLPGYDVPAAVEYAAWSAMLKKSREGFYERMAQFVSGLKKLKNK